MDEVWKDISQSNLGNDNPASALVSIRHRSAASFENFMAVAFKDGTSPTHLSLRSPASKRRAEHPPVPTPRPDNKRRWNKMIKNRESAARSRARKQAYTNELEREVHHLVQENTELKKEQEELKMAMAALSQATSKGKLPRAVSSPF